MVNEARIRRQAFPLVDTRLTPPETSAPRTDAAPGAMIPPRDRRFAMGVLLAGVMCVGMGQTVIFSALPPLTRELGIADIQIAGIFAASSFFWALTSPIWGRRSDRVGRKPMVLLGLFGFSLSITLFAAMISLGLSGAVSGVALYALMVGARSIYGIIGSATPAGAQGYIADRTPPERRAAGLSKFTAAFGVGAMLGPAVGGLAAGWGPLAPFYGVAGLACLMMLAIVFFLPERSAPLQRADRPRLRATDPRLRTFMLIALGNGIINAVPIQTITFYFVDVLGVPLADAAKIAGFGLTAGAGAALLAQIVLVQMAKVPPRILLRFGPIAVLAGHLLVVASHNAPMLSLGLAIAGFGVGMGLPGNAAGASLSVGPDEQGAAAGLINSAGTIGFVFSPFVGFLLYALAPQAAFLLTAAIAALLTGFAWTNPTIRTLGR